MKGKGIYICSFVPTGPIRTASHTASRLSIRQGLFPFVSKRLTKQRLQLCGFSNVTSDADRGV